MWLREVTITINQCLPYQWQSVLSQFIESKDIINYEYDFMIKNHKNNYTNKNI